MSVCASANLYNSRKVAPSSRRPLPNNERWAALNKNIFQDILNAILFQTPFSPSAATGRRHLLSRSEINPVSSSPPTSAESNEAVSEADSKENVAEGLELAENDGCNCRMVEMDGLTESTSRRRREDDDDDDDEKPAVKANDSLPEGVDKPAAEGISDVIETAVVAARQPLPAEVCAKPEKSDVVCSSVAATRCHDLMSRSYSPSRLTPGAGDDNDGGGGRGGGSERSRSPPFSVYCETFLANVPMMIIGLRPFAHREDSSLPESTNQMSLKSATNSVVLKKCPTEISHKTASDRPLPGKSPMQPDTQCPRKCSFNKRATILNNKSNRLQPQVDNSLKPVSDWTKEDRLSKSYHFRDHQLHHHQQQQQQQQRCHNQHHSDTPLDAAERSLPSSADQKLNAAETKSVTNTKTSRDHSILTILGLMSADDDGDRKKSAEKPPGPQSSGKGAENKRLVGIGVTVTGGSRWMAVDKCIVYDMIDHVLSGERDCLIGTSSNASCNSTGCLSSADRRLHALTTGPMYEHWKASARADTQSVRRCSVRVGADSRGLQYTPVSKTVVPSNSAYCDLTDKHDIRSRDDLKSTSPRFVFKSQQHTSNSSSNSSNSADEGISCLRQSVPREDKPQQQPSFRDSLEGVSVLRSLLSDDTNDCSECPMTSTVSKEKRPASPSDVRLSTPSATLASGSSSSSSSSRRATDRCEAQIDECRQVKRSRQSVAADSKKRRTIDAPLHSDAQFTCDPPSSSCPSVFGASPTSDQSASSSSSSSSSSHSSCKSSPAVKWKSSMLKRMRTEGLEDDATTCSSAGTPE